MKNLELQKSSNPPNPPWNRGEKTNTWLPENLWTNTLPKTNIAPTNGWLEYYFPIGEAYFQGLR